MFASYWDSLKMNELPLGEVMGVHSNRSGKYLKTTLKYSNTALWMNELPLGEVTGGFIQTAVVNFWNLEKHLKQP